MQMTKRLRKRLYSILPCIGALLANLATAQTSSSPELLDARTRLLEADAVRRLSRPVAVDLRGQAGGHFWDDAR